MRLRPARPTSTLASLVALALMLPACSTTREADEATGDRQGRELADAQVGIEAEALADDLEAVAWLGRSRYLHAQVPVPAGEDPGGPHVWDVERQLLVSEPIEDGGVEGHQLTVRVRVHVVPGNTSDWDQPGEATVARCFSFAVYDDRDVAPEEVDCPDVEPIVVDADVVVPPRPSVGEADRTAIRRFLEDGGVAAEVAVLQARLGPGLTARATDDGGSTGVAVTARPDGDDCAVGRRDRAGRVEVWHPPAVVTAPGEIGCDPLLAIDPPAPPH